ncbi:histidine phosphatase family protein [Rhabdothermincola salaria]|uniref:histidine phosphatase family protein n=1 Tax=Rhabdothermincola salaria TaxID=2903142 RepID=UPI001E31F014|nr:histidine phosphatase family protein [Rhabdothermincola salaria]
MSDGSAGPPDVYLVRHGATEWSRDGRHTGRTDIPLLPEGEEQARATGALLAGRTFSTVLTSPLQRARRTAELAGHAAAEVDDDLVEWDYGDYEGVTSREIQRTVPDWTVWSGPIPGGETLAEVATRCDRVIERLRAVDGDSLVVAHGHLLRVFTARWCRLDPVEGRRFVLGTATLSRLGWEHDMPCVHLWNARG